MFKAEDFPEVTSHEALSDHMACGFGPDGDRGTPAYATNAADALAFVDDDVFMSYGDGAGGLASEAALHANICALQTSAAYARDVLLALADYPTLLAQVEEAIQERKAAGPRP